VSLLLDALKRAEQEKQARGAGTPAPAAPPSQPASRAASLELQPIGPAQGAGPAPAHAARPDAASAHAAQNVFQAKAGAAAEPEAERSRMLLWVTVGAVAIVAIAAAGYVWYTVKGLAPQYSGTPRPRPAPTPPPASSAPVVNTSAAGAITPAVPGASPATTTLAAPGSSPAAAGSAPAPNAPTAAVAAPVPTPEPAAPARPVETAADRLARAAVETPPRPPLQLERTAQGGKRVPAELTAGYEALRKGDAAGARRAYQAALASDSTSVDALLGLATLAAREGNRVVASENYRRALDLDPRNPTALAGMATLADLTRPEAVEAQLRADLDRSPDSAALHFALANLYATQGRWTEAQSAYYEAHRFDPGSPEVAHNLAVSLDRLGQRRLAAGFYRRALENARGRASPVDTAAVTRRLAEIE
jgi:Tfp pilus assembly protein PilF